MSARRSSARTTRLVALAVLTTTFLGAALLFSSSARADCGSVEPLDVLPVDEVCESWVRDGEPQTAHDETELFELINGAAGLYIYYGFVAAVLQNYAGTVVGQNTPATLSVFNQGSVENAQNLFLDESSGTGTLIEGWGGSGMARIQADFGMTVLDFQEECFFARVLVLSDDEEGIQAAYCLALATIDRIQGAVPSETNTWGEMKSLYR